MTRTTERAIWIGVVVLLLVIGGVLIAGPAGKMMAMCQEMIGGGMMNSGTMPSGGAPPNASTAR